MAIVYDIVISVTVKTDEPHNPHFRRVVITSPDATFETLEKYSSTWPEVLYQAEICKKNLEHDLAVSKRRVKSETRRIISR